MNDSPITTLTIVAVTAFAVWYYLKKNGKSIDDLGFPQGGGSVKKGFDPNVIADDLYHSMDGFGLFHPGQLDDMDRAFTELLHQNDATVISIYKTFNNKYQRLGNGTLTKWISDKWISVWGAGTNHAKLQSSALQRLRLLGCK